MITELTRLSRLWRRPVLLSIVQVARQHAYRLTCARQGFAVGTVVGMATDPDHLYKIIALDADSVKLREVSSITGALTHKKTLVIEYAIF